MGCCQGLPRVGNRTLTASHGRLAIGNYGELPKSARRAGMVAGGWLCAEFVCRGGGFWGGILVGIEGEIWGEMGNEGTSN